MRTIGSICLLLSVFLGCGPRYVEFIPIKNGFGYVHTEGGIDRAPSAELYYQTVGGKKTDLCILVGDLFIKDDLAILISETPDKSGAMWDRLFAVKAPGPAVDITEDVVRLGAKEQGKNAETLLQSYGLPQLMQKNRDPNNLLPVCGISPATLKEDEIVALITVRDPANNGNLVVILNWDQIASLINSNKGVTH
jgi:hypothetical protein